MKKNKPPTTEKSTHIPLTPSANTTQGRGHEEYKYSRKNPPQHCRT